MVVFIRSIILYSFVILVMRIMGKRQIGELQPFELVIAIMLSELAAVPMQDPGIPLINGIIPILTLMLLEILISFLTLKYQSLRKITCGIPSILIRQGKIDENEMRNQRFNLNDLIEELRMAGYIDFEDIEYAILETSGKISIIPKMGKSPALKEDLNISKAEPKLPLSLVLDGILNEKNLEMAGYNRQWIKEKLKENNIENMHDVFIAIIDSKGDLIIQRRQQ